MHVEVYDWVTRVLDREAVEGKRILEVGALDVNGSVRPYVTSLKPTEYIGVDKRKGRRVDRVVAAEHLIEAFGCEAFDVVLCLETLEHVRLWRLALFNIGQVLTDGGLLLITTRGRGFPRHEHPDDYWRFSLSIFLRVFKDWRGLVVADDPGPAGIFVRVTKFGVLRLPALDRIHALPAPQ